MRYDVARRTENNASGLIDLVASMPWWAGIALAVTFYLGLHAFASSPLPPATQHGSTGNVAVAAVLRGLATGGQYALPIICMVGAFISAMRRSKRRTLARSATDSEATRMVDGMSWREFEMLVGEAFRIQGYKVEETGGGGADGGVDLVLTKAGERFLVQCKDLLWAEQHRPPFAMTKRLWMDCSIQFSPVRSMRDSVQASLTARSSSSTEAPFGAGLCSLSRKPRTLQACCPPEDNRGRTDAVPHWAVPIRTRGRAVSC